MKAMYSISKNLHNRSELRGEDIATWIDFREELKKEMSTSMCETSNNGNFCCTICLSGWKSMFCSHADFLTEPERLDHKHILDIKSRQWRMRGKKLYRGRHAVTVDLFATSCNKPMLEQVCSEFVSIHILTLNSWRLLT